MTGGVAAVIFRAALEPPACVKELGCVVVKGDAQADAPNPRAHGPAALLELDHRRVEQEAPKALTS